MPPSSDFPVHIILHLRFLTGGGAPQGGVNKFSGGREPLHALKHGKFLNRNASLPNVTLVRILRRSMFFGLVPAKMEVGVKFLEIFRPNSSLHLRVATRGTV